MNKKSMPGYKDGGSVAEEVMSAIKRLKIESGAAISEKEMDEIVRKLLRQESGAAISKKEKESVKNAVKKSLGMNQGGMAMSAAGRKRVPQASPKARAPANLPPLGMRKGGAATKNKRPPSSNNCGLYGRVQGKMNGGAMQPMGMKGGGMPNISNKLRRP